MSYSIYPNQFNFNDNGTYKGLAAIKGNDGNAAGFGAVTASIDGTSGTPTVTVTTSGSDTAKNINFAFSGLKGEGIGDGVFTPVVSFDAARPSDASNNTLWVKDSSSLTVGEVMVGTSTTTPSTRPNGTALQDGDMYVVSGNDSTHTIQWGNVTINPQLVFVRSTNAWVSKQAEFKLGGNWYPAGAMWIIENGEIVGQFIYDSAWSAEKVNDTLIVSSPTTGSAGTRTFTFGSSMNDWTAFVEGSIINGNGTGKCGATDPANGGSSSTSPTYASSRDIISNTVVVNPSYYYVGTNNAKCFGITLYYSVTAPSSLTIKNMYFLAGNQLQV